MKVGDYVRTKYGITQFKEYDTADGSKLLCMPVKDGSQGIFANVEDVIKSSPNIIDLIEVGDYVNGSLAEFSGTITWDKDMKPITKAIKVKQGGYDVFLNNENIKSIVTSEQFSQMEYRTGE